MADAIDLSAARLGSRDSIDVRAWPIITTITRLTIYGDGRRMAVIPEFAQAKAWPRVPNVEGGPINWTLWMGHQIAGVWRVLAICTCVDDDYVPTGPVLQPGHIPQNLYYASYAEAPLAGYQPTLGEPTVFFLTSGCTRRANTQGIPQPGRSQVVLVPLTAGTWECAGASTPPGGGPTPVPVPPAADLVARVAALEDLVRDHTRLLGLLSEMDAVHDSRLAATEMNQRTTAAKLDTLVIPTRTRATSARIFGITIPIPAVPLE